MEVMCNHTFRWPGSNLNCDKIFFNMDNLQCTICHLNTWSNFLDQRGPKQLKICKDESLNKQLARIKSRCLDIPPLCWHIRIDIFVHMMNTNLLMLAIFPVPKNATKMKNIWKLLRKITGVLYFYLSISVQSIGAYSVTCLFCQSSYGCLSDVNHKIWKLSLWCDFYLKMQMLNIIIVDWLCK